ncbi:ligase-associated DNA damage response DEXH box helicase [Allorhizobium sp. BGMRC 0089]|uniref:ligase-associated DNA damage response DEXH box helicase n=1 Tax=Allorhizobium sonneratiae TaxID=2934936 RepID=UPI0020340B5A|nr:ligase-associated DNA damage response DEXH box helicase [Allorhizobium sonneratiae]MCM2291481.1 ligase-associated DNA damage response DEXH box helicase [Allorhizobium sonneratiae]
MPISCSVSKENAALSLLPPVFLRWFAEKGWTPRAHQIELLERAIRGDSTLLIAPTGAGKTLAGFLPALVDLVLRKEGAGRSGPHTLYISPLKALAVDIERNLMAPVVEMGLSVTVETRTGDTPQAKRQRQKRNPPDILLTTPEQLALLIASPDAGVFFKGLRFVVFDELHSLVTSKRGHLLSLGLARLRRLAPALQTIGLSATVADPPQLQRWLVAQTPQEERLAGLVTVSGGARPDITILKTQERIPWSGHSARYAMPELYDTLKRFRMTIIFVNTRSQAEMLFQELWTINDDNLPIALHHGSLDVAQRRKVEQAMAESRLRAVVATSTLDLGIDWGEVDLVVHVGAPKGASRLAQRIGRANHRMDEPSRAILIPANRFEVMECQAALDANYLGAQDTSPVGEGPIDVLAQHILGMACAGAFDENDLYDEVTSVTAYQSLSRDDFSRVIDFVATGGYALKSYERYARIRQRKDGLWRVSNPQVAQQYRLNLGTIIEEPMLTVRLAKRNHLGSLGRGGMALGQVEEYFVEQLSPGDTFLFSGKVLRFEGLRESECLTSNAFSQDPKIPAYAGGKFPLSTFLADQVRAMLDDPARRQALPEQVRDWLDIQQQKSVLPRRGELLVECFPRGKRFYLIAYPFEGRLAHQTLGMLLTRRLERLKARPLGFVATDYALAIWGLEDMGAMIADGRLSLASLFEEDMLGDDLEAWLDESFMLKRTFRAVAIIAGLIEKRHPGKEKTGRQVTVSTDLIYDVLRSHEPDHILLQATRADAANGLLDIARLGAMLRRINGHIRFQRLDQVSPLAVPVMLEIGREPVYGEAEDTVLAEAADALLAEALV